MTTPTAPPSRARAWLLASRPATLPAAVGPVLVGLGVAVGLGIFEPLPALGALAVALVLQIVSNLANDLSDFRSGADAADRLGPARAAAQGWLSQREMAAGIAVMVGLAGLIGLYLVWIGGLPILLLGVAAIVSAFAYTGGPWPYGYRGLGEVFVFVFFGLVAVSGTTYLQTLRWEPLAIIAAIPVGALVTAILVVNNLRDIDADRRARKLTLAARRGPRFAMAEYDTLLVFAYATPLLVLVGGGSLTGGVSFVILLPWLTIPLALSLRRVVRAGGDPRRLNAVLKGTARLSLSYSLLFAAGLAVGDLR